MEALIDLIFGNILILGAVISGLIALFGRISAGNNESKDGEKGRNSRNNTGQHQNGKSEEPPDTRTSGSVPETEPAASLSQPENGYEQQMEEWRKKQKRAHELTNEAARSSNPLSASSVSGENQERTSGIAPITPENAKQGVLWAEILGPPVSKRNKQRGTFYGPRSRR
ncbi:hypothetical protein [Salibacterium halotolerans]|uniref:Uncharacterized protein n=1 Tax=Salibacterium halotolerans TaxID=1884432 RepID=A0A1I5NFW9_9BACI|nr:hypothetical protein [Salibacterium halotolerans]SFP20735.1 hypothetical protein SAMN05518683_103129 [Salibacterium halotolerans]